MMDETRDSPERRVHPKLRMMMNGSAIVNACRAENSGCIAVEPSLARTAPRLAAAVTAAQVPPGTAIPSDLSVVDREQNVTVNAFVQLSGGNELPQARAANGNLAIVTTSMEELEEIRRDPSVAFIEPAETLHGPKPTRSAPGDQAPPRRVAQSRDGAKLGTGNGVLIGIVDVEGFDWTHPDFVRDGTTRFVSIWDQGGAGRTPEGFTRGREITADDMARALKHAPEVRVSPHDLEPQSSMIEGSHGTHVASIAAGNGGLCPEADIAAVLIALPREDMTARTSFYDSTSLLEAIRYLLELADRRGQPISINVSLGTNGHAHDGSSALDRWIDAWLASPGRSICVAAGNAGQDRPVTPGDLGYMVGRIHTSGHIAAGGLTRDIEWVVAGNSIIDVSENELEIWYEAQDRLEVSVKPPGREWIGPIAPGEFIENLQLPDRTMLSVYNERFHPANGHNYIAIYLSPFMGDPVVGIAAGTWIVRLHGAEVRDGRYHGWIERDDPVQLDERVFFWPSFFSAGSNVDESSVSSLACGPRIVSVANLDELRQRVNVSSSQGPTRDGRFKPDVAAPGTDIRAANGFGRPDEPWIEMTGTSMASPYVTGVIGLMFAEQRGLTAAQINGIIKATARPLPGASYAWLNDSGFGVVDPPKCVEAAKSALARVDQGGRFE